MDSSLVVGESVGYTSNMILVFDARQLEWRAVAHNSEDKTAIQEIKDGLDFHSDNQKKFKLPDRLTSKKFLFRAIFKGSAYAYSVDNDFKHIGGTKYWQNVIDRFYEKYDGIYKYHADLMREAQSTGRVISNTGRIYYFEPRMRRGELKWPENDIVNYPVQGFSADLMSLIRVSAWNRLKEWRESGKLLFVNTVHDNLVLDLDGGIKDAVEVSKIVRGSFQDCGKNYQKIYKKELLIPMDTDAKVGINYKHLHELKI
jgi:DNA polymerase I-like protein with 3'-5' exonuclease and polymerase domains